MRDYLSVCLGAAEGTLHVGVGLGPHVSEAGKYIHERWEERRYAWPGEADRAVTDMLTTAPDADVYVCPYVMRGDRRAKGEAVTHTLVHADVDDLIDIEKVRALGGFAVGSGSRGHGHGYVALAEPVTAAQHEVLCRALGGYLGAVDAKISDNDVLRAPETVNHKLGAGPVRWLVHPSERVPRTPGDLARQLGVKLGNALASSPQASRKPTVAPVDLDLSAHPAVQAELGRVTGDRSSDIYRVLSSCRSAGLTFNEASNVVNSRPDLAAKLTECGGDDLTRCWIKLCDDQQRLELPDGNASAESTGGTDGTTTASGMPKLWAATDLMPATQARWLAKDRLPQSAVTLLIGDEGIGKSLLWVWVAAAVTTGKALPGFGIPARDPSPVIVAVTEDDWSTTVLPRLIVAGADLAMIQVVCTEQDGTGSPVFPRDLFLIAEADPSPVLIVVDAWLDTVPAGMSVRDPQQARQALHPFKELASSTDCAVLLLCHTNRVATPNARDRYGATGELRKKARMTLFAQQDDEGHLVVGPEKMNTAKPIPASTFTITSVQHFEPTEDHDGTVPLVSYLGESDQTAREHLADAYATDREISGDPGDVLAWLAAELAAGPRWATELYTAGEEAGHSSDKLKRAKRKLRVESERDGVVDRWFWRLPHHQGSTPSPSVAPLHPYSLAPHPKNQGSASTSEESKRVNGEVRPTLATGDNQDEIACRVCGRGINPVFGIDTHYDCARRQR
ncbi:AAA family ATPase [Mycobacterium sp. 21AC1]|uniref:AAA family ATPase n=1 Tax=[Mycobacterium] appelbergii TaxID=2939269 RepID=UPI0029391C3A|nr:AAA family ATPase [Mycobacterium sp. 21AC1]MDV3130013.1 AAA family ATPase [Mycobacterium sp. 21AC1]